MEYRRCYTMIVVVWSVFTLAVITSAAPEATTQRSDAASGDGWGQNLSGRFPRGWPATQVSPPPPRPIEQVLDDVSATLPQRAAVWSAIEDAREARVNYFLPRMTMLVGMYEKGLAAYEKHDFDALKRIQAEHIAIVKQAPKPSELAWKQIQKQFEADPKFDNVRSELQASVQRALHWHLRIEGAQPQSACAPCHVPHYKLD